MTLLLSASLVNCFLMITFSLTGLLRWENFTSTLGFYFSHKISYEVAWFTVTSFRRTPICFSSEKHFKCEFKISDSLFHQGVCYQEWSWACPIGIAFSKKGKRLTVAMTQAYYRIYHYKFVMLSPTDSLPYQFLTEAHLYIHACK